MDGGIGERIPLLPMKERTMKILLIKKKSFYTIFAEEKKDRKVLTHIKKGGLLSERFLKSHRDNEASFEKVKSVLKKNRVRFSVSSDLTGTAGGGFDLYISVGGDGTILDASHYSGGAKILGGNSSPGESVGNFCCCTAANFEEILKKILDGGIKSHKLPRLRILLNGKPLPFGAMNDILFAHKIPAATSRYIIKVKEQHEIHKSSGVWVSTAAGSTGAILSAGGAGMDIKSGSIQFVVREPFSRRDEPYRITGGVVKPGELAFVSRMVRGAVYIDGQRKCFSVGFGDLITFEFDTRNIDIFLPEWKF